MQPKFLKYKLNNNNLKIIFTYVILVRFLKTKGLNSKRKRKTIFILINWKGIIYFLKVF
jgi:hypothetical protein